MTQFDSEIEANDSGARFEALSKPGLGVKGAMSLLNLIRSVIFPDPNTGLDIAAGVREVVSAWQEDREAQTTRESEYLLQATVLEVKRHESTITAIQDRVQSIETRLEVGLKLALRFPNDGSEATLQRLAIVVVRGAIDFESNPQEQTNEFLRIASQITESEVAVLRRIYEFQAETSRQAGHALNQSNWLSNVMHAWVSMNKSHPPDSDQWMQRKSALVRLESYGFVEKTPGNATSEGGEMGQMPYALLPLGLEFCEYIKHS